MRKRRFRQLKDQLAGKAMGALTATAAALVLVMAVALVTRAWPLLSIQSPGKLLTSSKWHPLWRDDVHPNV